MRPLFDALYDTMDPEKLNTFMERGTIEVAPLAFMRGRAQPLDAGVLTPDGFRPIGISSRRRSRDRLRRSADAVLGVYPQGRKSVFRVWTQDGASTLCCDEHLWHVFTPEDRRRGKPGRVLETREMVGRLRRFHQHRYELPLAVRRLSEFEPRGGSARPVRARTAARRRLSHDFDNAELLHRRLGACDRVRGGD